MAGKLKEKFHVQRRRMVFILKEKQMVMIPQRVLSLVLQVKVTSLKMKLCLTVLISMTFHIMTHRGRICVQFVTKGLK